MDEGVLNRNNVKVEGNITSSMSIVFAHGFGTDQTVWTSVKKHFAAHYRLILFDNVGAGKADLNAYSPLKYRSIDAYATDLIQICDALNLENAIYVGHSVSGMTGLLAAQQAPELFSKIVLIGASPRYLNDSGYTGGFTQADLDTLYEEMTSNYYGWVSGFSGIAMANGSRPYLQNSFAQSLLSIRPDIAVAVARSIFQSDFRHILPKITQDVLVVQAKQDFAVPSQVAGYLSRELNKSKLIVVDAEGHFPHLSAPGIIAEAIRNFVK